MKKKINKAKKLCLFITFLFIGNILLAQGTSIKGNVLDEFGQTLPGVNVIVKGTTIGVITDIDGNFELEIENPKEKILEFSSLGFKSVEVKLGTKLVFNIVLNEDAIGLDEVVVVGYGSMKRSQMSTAVSKLDSKTLESAPRGNVATALQGSIAGLRISNATGQPGATPSIVLRGGSSFSGSGTPLVLIDGVEGSFFALNSEDIKSITVLKDAASTAIYGAKAADGVILVVTKTGIPGQSSITYKFKYGVNKRRESVDYLSAEQYIKYNRLAVKDYTRITEKTNFSKFLNGSTSGFGTGGNTTTSITTTQFLTDQNSYLLKQPGWHKMQDPLDPTKEILYMENDMSELFFQESTVKDHHLDFNGGNEKGLYSLGLGYMDNDGIVFGSNFERFSGKLNTSYKIKDNFKISSNILYSRSKYYRAYLGDATVFRRAAGQSPTSRIYQNNPDGTLSNVVNPGTNRGFGNPLYYRDKSVRNNLENRLSVGVTMLWNILPELNATLNGSYFYVNNGTQSFNKAYLDGGKMNSQRISSASSTRNERFKTTFMLEYKKKFFNKHDLNILLGTEYNSSDYFGLSGSTKKSPSDLIPTMNVGSEANGKPYSYYTENLMISQFGRFVYDYNKRYILNFSYRLDGSSRLGNDKWDIFPAASFAWNIHNENFFKKIKRKNIISEIKPRISYGVNGNIKSLSNYGVYGLYGKTSVYDGKTGFVNSTLPTLDLLWERSTTLDFGLDLSFLNNRIKIITDYFIRDVIDLQQNYALPYWTGFYSIKTNNGILRNKGFEFEISADIFKTKDFSWNLSATLFTVKNSVVKLPDNENENNRQGGTQVYNPSSGEVEWVGGLQEGKEIGRHNVYTYKQDFIYTTQAQLDADKDRVDMSLKSGNRKDNGIPFRKSRYLGDVRWKDLNGDNIIDSKDRVFVGRTIPDFTGGISTNLYYKGFNLFVKTDFAVGHIIRNEARVKGNAQTQGSLNGTSDVLNTWTPENPNTNIPRFTFVDAQKNHYRNSIYWEKGDYFAIREVTLAYDFSSDIFKKFFAENVISGLQLYFTGSNLAYFKSYSGVMPEQGGYDMGRYPMPKIYTFGVKVKF